MHLSDEHVFLDLKLDKIKNLIKIVFYNITNLFF